MSGNTNRKALSKYKPHPILGRNFFKPILELFSPKKKSNELHPVERDGSPTLPGSYPRDSKPREHVTGANDDGQPSTSSQTSEESRKRRLERTKSRMASPAPRHATSVPKASVRHPKSSKSKSKSKSFDRLNKEVKKAIKPIRELGDEDRIFVDQLDKLDWTHNFRTGLVEGRDKAERARSIAPERLRQREEKLAQLLEEEKEIKKQLEKQKAKQKLREVTRKMEQRQMKAAIEKAVREVEEQVKQGEIRRERTRELILVVNRSELDIMASSRNVDQESARVEFEKLAEARKKLADEQAATRQQVEEVARAHTELEETKKRLQAEEEAARAQAAQATAHLDEMVQEYHRLRQQIHQLQNEKEAAQRQSDDILFQARQETRRIRQAHDKAVRETQDMAARNVTEAMTIFQAQLEQEAMGRIRAEQQAAAATAAAEAMMAAAAAAPQPMDVQNQPFQPMDVQREPLEVPQPQPQSMDVQYQPQWQAPLQPMNLRGWGWELPPPYDQNRQLPLPLIMTDADRIILYERKWAALKGEMNEIIVFQQVPWPILIELLHPDQLVITEIYRFISNETYLRLPGQESKSLRERIRLEMLRWHPDRFDRRVLPKVEPTHRQAVKETAERVARMLTQIMSEAPNDGSS